MANTLTNLIPTLYEAMDIVSRELVGLVPSVTMDSTAERAAVGQTIRSFVTPASTAADITPGQLPPNTGDQTIGNRTLSISKSRAVPVRWNGEEQKGVDHGPGYRAILRDQFTQAMRTLTNEIETDLAGLYSTVSGSTGTAGTTPFASNLADTANVRKSLMDRGAPVTDLQMVLDTTAGAKMRTLTQLTKVNESADTSLLRQGVLLDVHGFAIRESAQIQTHTAGTGAGAVTDNAGYAVGATTVTMGNGTSGTIVAGDQIAFAGDANQYTVLTGDADVSDGGTVVLQEPGLRQAIPGSATAITVLRDAITLDYVGNMAFARSAIQLVTRAPAIPEEGDSADDSAIITDPRSGLSMEVRLYREYRQMKYEIGIAWGYSLIKPEHAVLLLG